jgi:uncharacterized protein YndB with AHSA1/START domain
MARRQGAEHNQGEVMDILAELEQAHRRVREQPGDSGLPHRVELERSYRADVEDVWDACTTAERLARWFLPVTGDLRLGGHYQLEGNAGGTVHRCDPPQELEVTWEFGDSTSVVTLRLSRDDGGCRLLLAHQVADDEHWRTYGPGAVGVGWDGALLLGLAAHLAGAERPDGDPSATPEGQDFMRRSAAAWGVAHREAGVAESEAQAAAQRTSAAYAPEEATTP